MMSHLVIIPLLLPLLTGILLLLLRGSATELHRLINLAATLGLVAVALLLLMQTGEGQVEVYRLGNWSAPFGIVLAADRLAAVMVLVTGLLATGVLLHGRRVGSYFRVLFQMQLFGLNGAFLTGDLFNLFVFFEVLLIASYGLLLLGGGRNRTRAGLHYVVLNLVGSTLFLFAVGSLYGVLGTLNMADMASRIGPLMESRALLVGLAMMTVGFGIKAAVFPMHGWLPDVYTHASPPVSALISAVMTKVSAYALFRILFQCDQGSRSLRTCAAGRGAVDRGHIFRQFAVGWSRPHGRQQTAGGP